MNSSVEQLKEALQWIMRPNDNSYWSASYSMWRLPENVYTNKQLKNAWDQVYNFLQSIQSEVSTSVHEVYEDILKYIETVEMNDVTLLNAINKNNEVSQSILNKLKSLSL